MSNLTYATPALPIPPAPLLVDLYDAWHAARNEASLLGLGWHGACAELKRDAYIAYAAALEREDAAAAAFMRAAAK